MNDVHPTEPLPVRDAAELPNLSDLPNVEESIGAKLAELQEMDPAEAPDLAAEVADELAEALDEES